MICQASREMRIKMSSQQVYWESRLSQRFDLTGAGYAALSQHYNRQMYQQRIVTLKKILSRVGFSSQGTKVLEVGCGTGFYTQYFARQEVSEYLGLDIASVSIAELSDAFPDFNFAQLDVSRQVNGIPVDFDMVLVADVLFHIVDEESFRTAVRNISSWVRAGGLVVLSDIFPESTVRTCQHCCHRGLEEYEELLSEFQLDILSIEPIFVLLQPPPRIPGVPVGWGIYQRLWQLGMRMVGSTPLDRILSKVLGWLDRELFLERYGKQAPNSKWMVAVKQKSNEDYVQA
jgi:2-polyprenyl-3-methyl-5-hydroxy-6-metoxy-1,4-benzoquinol methylase